MPAYHDGKHRLKPRLDSSNCLPLCVCLQKHGASTVYTKHNKVE